MKIKKQNIFVKSVLRQPLRSLVLLLLIAATAFAFVLRTTEFVVVRERIYEVAEFYSSTGFLHVRDEAYGNIAEAANILAASPMVGFEDIRRGAEAVMHGVENAQVGGRIGNGGHLLHGMEAFHRPIAEREHYVYFYGVVERIREHNSATGGHFIEIRLTVDEVTVGFAEHAVAGQTIDFRYFMEDGENSVAGMIEGERYFMRGAFYWVSNYGRGIRWSPPSISFYDILYMHPLNDDGLMYVHVPHGNVDFSAPGLEHLPDSIAQMQYNKSAVWLRTSADMSAMPIMQEEFRQVMLVDGRFLNHEDHLEGRQVAVIHQGLAARRGLSIGDTITVSVPSQQEIVDLNTVAYFERGTLAWRGFRDTFVMGNGFLDFAILGNPEEFMIEGLELEIVGTYVKLPSSPEGLGPWTYTAALLSNYVYIPDSLLPPDFMPVDSMHGYNDFIWSNWYSFALADTRHEAAFLLEYRETLAALGVDLYLIPSGSANFWELAEPTLASITINAIMFWIVLLLVFGLTAFLYTNQRRREFAILRALGSPANDAAKQLLTPMILLGIPAIIIGGIFGWTFALSEVQRALEPMSAIAGVELYLEFPLIWLVLQLAAAIIVMLALVYAFVASTAKQPVLEMLQGRTSKTFTKSAGQALPQTQVAVSSEEVFRSYASSPITAEEQCNSAKQNKIMSNTRFVYRHIMRAPAKSLLTMGVAVFFILSLIVLRHTIITTERDLAQLYDNTILSGELVEGHAMAHSIGDLMHSTIRRQTVDALLEHGLIQDYYLEAGHYRFFIVTEADGFGSPDGVYVDGFWNQFWNYIAREHHNFYTRRTNALFAFNDVDKFLAEFGQQEAPGAGVGGMAGLYDLNVATEPFAVEFALGFGWADFVYHDATLQSPVPVILSVDTLEARGLAVGDTAYVVHSTARGAFHRPRDFIEAPIVVIGQHNGGIDRFLGRNAVLLPLPAMETMMGNELRYLTFHFDVNTALNRDLVSLRNDFDYLVDNRAQRGIMPLQVALHDEELRVAAAQMEQNLVLLQLLYPVAIALSLVIGSGLAILLMLQNARIAAILRVLGYGRLHTCTVIFLTHFIAAASGAMLTILAISPLLRISLVPYSHPALLAAIYLVGIIVGSVSGTLIITNRPPLALLQVRE